MANNTKISTAARNAAVDAVTALINAGGAGTMEIYDGAQPAGPGTAVSTQNKLATVTFSATAFGPAANGVATANAATGAAAIASGTAAWARVKSGAGTAVIDCTVGTGGTDVVLATAAIAVGVVVSITAFTLTQP